MAKAASESNAELSTPEDPARVYGTLEALVRAEGARLNSKGFRAYEVIENDGQRAWVATNSPGNAAMAVVEVKRVPGKSMLSAALGALAAT